MKASNNFPVSTDWESLHFIDKLYPLHFCFLFFLSWYFFFLLWCFFFALCSLFLPYIELNKFYWFYLSLVLETEYYCFSPLVQRISMCGPQKTASDHLEGILVCILNLLNQNLCEWESRILDLQALQAIRYIKFENFRGVVDTVKSLRLAYEIKNVLFSLSPKT